MRNLPWLKETSTTGHLFMSYKGFYALNLHPVNRTSIEQILLRTMAFFCGQTIHFLCGSTELTFVLCAISWIVYISWLICIFGCLLGGLAVLLKEIPHREFLYVREILVKYSNLAPIQNSAEGSGVCTSASLKSSMTTLVIGCVPPLKLNGSPLKRYRTQIGK